MRIFVVSLLVVAACGSSSTTSQPPEASAAAPNKAFADMTKEERGAYMKEVVLPAMKPIFQGYDAKAYAEMTCGTCHGKDARDKGFKMPNADLPVLPGTPAAFATLASEHPKAVTFMNEQVKPKMAELLGRPAYDPNTPVPNAFGCGGCHTSEAAGG